MSERERDVYYLLSKARDIARDANDTAIVLRIASIMQYIERRSESERTGSPEEKCPSCGMAWYPDCDQFGCWSCGYTKTEDL